MRKLLDTASQRMIGILESLVNQESWTTIGELAGMMDASERTVSGDISVLKQRWGNFLDIEVSTNKGIRINNLNVPTMGRVFLDIFNDSTALKWLEALFYHPYEGIEFYEKKLFVSKSTLFRIIPRINQFFEDKHFVIACKANKYSLNAQSEANLRQFFACFLIELHSLNPRLHPDEPDFGVIRRIVLDITAGAFRSASEAERSYIMGDEITIAYYTLLYYVSLVRENQGFALAPRPAAVPADSEAIGGPDRAYLSKLFPRLCADDFCAVRAFIALQMRGWESDREEDLVDTQSRLFLKRTFEMLQYVPSSDASDKLAFMIKRIYLTQKHRMILTSALFDRIKYFALFFKKYNQYLYGIVERNLAQFSAAVRIDMAPMAQNIVFWICMTCPEFSNRTRPKAALIVSDFGAQHASYLTRYLAAFFNDGVKAVVTFSHARFEEAASLFASGRYNLVISTVPVPRVPEDQIILINDYPTYENLCSIYKVLKAT